MTATFDVQNLSGVIRVFMDTLYFRLDVENCASLTSLIYKFLNFKRFLGIWFSRYTCRLAVICIMNIQNFILSIEKGGEILTKE